MTFQGFAGIVLYVSFRGPGTIRGDGLWQGIRDVSLAFWLARGRSNLHVTFQTSVQVASSLFVLRDRCPIESLLATTLH
jgi:hypothetical protein